MNNRLREKLSAFHRDESGQVNLLVAVIVLGLGVASCFVGDVGQRIQQKMHVQNAADAISYSNGLWVARSLNALTTANHLMGELTAIVVIHESLGGPELDKNHENQTSTLVNESVELDRFIDSLSDKASYRPGLIPIPILSGPDRTFVKLATSVMIGEKSDWGRHKSGAAIFDSVMLLKHEYAAALTLKAFCGVLNRVSVALVGIGVTAPLGVTVEGFALAGHFYANRLIFDLLKERIFLSGLEAVVPLAASMKKPIRKILIPSISQYADSIVGVTYSKKGTLLKAPIVRAQSDTLNRLKDEYALDHVAQVQHRNRPQLPVEIETVEDDSGTEQQLITSPWAGEPVRGSTRDLLKELQKLQGSAREIKRVIGWANKILDAAGDLFATALPRKWRNDLENLTNVEKLLAIPDLSKIEDLQELDLKRLKVFSYNPSHELFKAPENRFNWEAEQHSQWMRATYPCVDSSRAYLRDFFHEVIPNSGMATYYTHWTKKYCMLEVYRLRRQRSFVDDDRIQSGNTNSKLKQDIRRRIESLISGYAKATQSIPLGEKRGNRDKLDSLAVELNDLANFISNPAVASLLKATGGDLGGWTEGVRALQQNAATTAQQADYDSGLELTESEFRNAVEAVALQQGIRDLIDAIADSVDNVINYIDPTSPPHMYRLLQSSPLTKGKEPWTTNKNLADNLFAITAAAHRDSRSSQFGPGIFKNPNQRGMTCFAQALVYNANSRKLDPKRSSIQINTGWDLLNWNPPVRAPEWWHDKPSKSRRSFSRGPWPWEWRFPYKVFTGQYDSVPSARVKLNWQCKLVPITERQLGKFNDLENCPASIRDNAEFLKQNSRLLRH